MNGATRRLYLKHSSAVLGGLVIFTALSCDLNNSLGQEAGTSKDAGPPQDGGQSCPALGGACQQCPNGYLSDDNGCATCKCKPTTTCIDTVACIAGDHWDSTLCKCVPSSPCPCASDQLCVFQIGGPAISNPPPSQCETPDPTCIQRTKMGGVVVTPCICLSAGDGNCTQPSVGSCTCDNGIR